jgi:hypothetical protein
LVYYLDSRGTITCVTNCPTVAVGNFHMQHRRRRK